MRGAAHAASTPVCGGGGRGGGSRAALGGGGGGGSTQATAPPRRLSPALVLALQGDRNPAIGAKEGKPQLRETAESLQRTYGRNAAAEFTVTYPWCSGTSSPIEKGSAFVCCWTHSCTSSSVISISRLCPEEGEFMPHFGPALLAAESLTTLPAQCMLRAGGSASDWPSLPVPAHGGYRWLHVSAVARIACECRQAEGGHAGPADHRHGRRSCALPAPVLPAPPSPPCKLFLLLALLILLHLPHARLLGPAAGRGVRVLSWGVRAGGRASPHAAA